MELSLILTLLGKLNFDLSVSVVVGSLQPVRRLLVAADA